MELRKEFYEYRMKPLKRYTAKEYDRYRDEQDRCISFSFLLSLPFFFSISFLSFYGFFIGFFVFILYLGTSLAVTEISLFNRHFRKYKRL